ncbi:unnamed protein product [Closterium sp. NIES-65]|nr:unnamed protein product [Closterium sp. NIES-65]CAI6001079.1 unnamed protein product [Closterium sp. NIES-65]CAI6001090.1 unnamed protein product [Closterium sp. NIES-65]CAI6001106.1 unnamed protein product [Closterium sp. NIES-65]
MGIKGYQPIANLPGTATSLDEESLAAAVEAAANEKKPRHIRQLEQERLSVEELSELERMRANGSLPWTDEVVAALDRETGRRSGEDGARGGGEEKEQYSIQYAKHELKARLLKEKPIRSWIRELQVMWRDDTGAHHSAFIKARDGKEQGRGSSGFIDRLELDGSPVAPPLSEGSFVAGSGGFKLLLAETRSCKGKDEDEFHLTIDGLVDMGILARLAHPLMQTATEAQAHFNVHIARLNVSNILIVCYVLAVLCLGGAAMIAVLVQYRFCHFVPCNVFPSPSPPSPPSCRSLSLPRVQHTSGIHGVLGQTFTHLPPSCRSLLPSSFLQHTSGIHGVLGQTFRAEESRKVRSLRYRLLTRLLREPVEVESESGRGFLDGRTEDYITSDIHSADCMYAAAWRRGEHESSDGSDVM